MIKWLKQWLVLPIMVCVWLLALLYASGIGQAYDVYGKAKILVWLLVVYYMLPGNAFSVLSKRVVYFVGFFLVVSIITYLAYGKTTFDYIWLYLLIPLLGLLPLEEKQMFYVSIAYGALGLLVLFLRNYASIFNGWNPNSLAMIAFFSVMVMLASFSKAKSIYTYLFLGVYFILYYQWTKILNSRSVVLMSAIMLLFLFGVIPFDKWLKKSRNILVILFVPLVVALIVGYAFSAETVAALNAWSKATFGKPVFNGRDVIWRDGFNEFFKAFLIGNGNLSAYNWHNSAVTMLVGGGIIGFSIWIYFTHKILKKGTSYLTDGLVKGLIIGFLMIWLQQSVELGLVAGKANPIPYAMLGLLIARIKTLKKEGVNEEASIEHYRTRI